MCGGNTLDESLKSICICKITDHIVILWTEHCPTIKSIKAELAKIPVHKAKSKIATMCQLLVEKR